MIASQGTRFANTLDSVSCQLLSSLNGLTHLRRSDKNKLSHICKKVREVTIYMNLMRPSYAMWELGK